MKQLIKNITPPIIWRFLKIIKPKKYGWSGNYKSWDIAASKCRGYDDKVIFEKVKESSELVKSGKAVYERDSVLFDTIQYSFPLLSSLLYIASKNNNKLNIIDFGGALGSTYFQNIHFLKHLEKINWYIVEQEMFVKEGKQNFETENLKFRNTIDDCIKENQKINVLLFSCVLPYLEFPFEILETARNSGVPYILIDNTPFNFQEKNRITIQKVPASIYEAEYPCWMLSKENVINLLSDEYKLFLESKSDLFLELDNKQIPYTNLFFEKK